MMHELLIGDVNQTVRITAKTIPQMNDPRITPRQHDDHVCISSSLSSSRSEVTSDSVTGGCLVVTVTPFNIMHSVV